MMRYLSTGTVLALVSISVSLQGASAVLAQQNAQVMSVTPPLFQISAVPGDVWQSSVKVVNGNKYPMTVYAEVVNFAALGESGQGRFIPVGGEEGEATLGGWITIAEGPHVIPPEKTKNVPFLIEFPKDAPPGGHYAAILITTKPPAQAAGEFSVGTSQAVTSLIFARMEGDVDERGTIREFRVEQTFVQTPEAEISLRFENKGNVHLQPRGDITITNMWGTVRGTIPINYRSHFGNVLPGSIRDFRFTWESELSFTDVGRYKAEVTLGYGENGVKSASSVTYFWVVPIKITLITLGILVAFILAIVWMVKAYVRRMLLIAGVPIESGLSSNTGGLGAVRHARVSEPIRSGVLDLRKRLDAAETTDVVRTVWEFIVQYRMFFFSVCLIIVIFVASALYIGRATSPGDDYRIIIDEGDVETTIEVTGEGA